MLKKDLSSFIIFASTLFILGGCGNDSNPANNNHDEHAHAEAVGCVVQQDDVELVRAEKGVVVGSFEVQENMESPLLNFYLVAEDSDLFRPEGEDFSFAWESKNSGIADAIQYESEGEWNFHLKGLSEGATSILFKVMHDDHDDFVSLDIPITVAPESGGGL